MTDVVYYDMLWKPLLHTLLLLSTASTTVLWANCNGYPHFSPDVPAFLKLIEEFFDVTVEEDRPQLGCGSPSELSDGRVIIRRLTLRDEEAAQEEVERAMARGCARR